MKRTKLIVFITAFFIIFIFSLLEYFKKHDQIDITSSFDIFSTISPLFLLIILAFKLFSDYLDE